MIMSLMRISLAGLLLYNFAFSAQSFAQNRPLKKVVWGQTALSAAMWIPWLAKEAKIYERNGLDVEIVLLRGSGQSSQALLGGSLFAAPVALPQLMLANLNGADIVNVAHTIASAIQQIARSDRRSDDRRTCVAKESQPRALGPRAIFFSATRCANMALNPDREITWLSIGTNAERLQALLAGVVDGADVAYPADVQAERKGYRILIDARKEIVFPRHPW